MDDIKIFECDACGGIHNSQAGQIPVGWSMHAGAVWCADCTQAGIPERTIGQMKPVRHTITTQRVHIRSQRMGLAETRRKILRDAKLAIASFVLLGFGATMLAALSRGVPV